MINNYVRLCFKGRCVCLNYSLQLGRDLNASYRNPFGLKWGVGCWFFSHPPAPGEPVVSAWACPLLC